MKTKLIGALIVAAVGTTGYFVYQKYFHSESGNAVIRSAYGNVEIREVNLGFRVGGRISDILVEEGDPVKPGQELALLDAEPLLLALATMEARKAAATEDLNRLRSGFRTEEIEQAKAQYNRQQVILDLAESEYKRQLTLDASQAGTRQLLDQAKAAFEEAQAGLEVARANFELVQSGFRKEDIAKAEALVRQVQSEIDQLKLQIKDTRLTTPSEGTVLVRTVEPGTIVGIGQTCIILSLDDRTWVRGYIDEQHLGHIHPGMKAAVYTDSRPDKPYSGHIGFISPKAEFTPKYVHTEDLRSDLIFRFRIILDAPDPGLRQGMPVTIMFDSQTEE